MPLPLMSEVEALLPAAQPPGGPSRTSEAARLPLVTLMLPLLRYTLPCAHQCVTE